MDTVDKHWKLKLRYGKLQTPFQHYSVIAEGLVGELMEGFSCRKGNAFMGMKVWASSTEEAENMSRVIGREIGFDVTGRVYVYSTEPSEPPDASNPRAYQINFNPFDPDK
jgi:hypothetical protein